GDRHWGRWLVDRHGMLLGSGRRMVSGVRRMPGEGAGRPGPAAGFSMVQYQTNDGQVWGNVKPPGRIDPRGYRQPQRTSLTPSGIAGNTGCGRGRGGGPRPKDTKTTS